MPNHIIQTQTGHKRDQGRGELWGVRLQRMALDGRDPPNEWQAERFRDKEQEIGRQGRTGRILPTGEI